MESWISIAGLAVRHGLTTIGGYLAGKGLLGTDPTAVENFVGAGMIVAGVAWSAWQKWGKVMITKETAKAKAIPPSAVSAP